MSRLFRRRSGQAATPEPGSWLDLAETVLGSAGANDPARVRAALDYVAHGTDHSWRAPSGKGASMHLPVGGSGDALRGVAAAFATAPLDQVVRFLEVYETLSGPRPQYGFHPTLDAAAWLPLMLGPQYVWNSRLDEAEVPLDAELVERILVAQGHPASLGILAAFCTPGGSYGDYWHQNYRAAYRRLHGFDAAVARNADALRPQLTASRVDDRLAALEALAVVRPDTLALFAAEIAACATGTSAQAERAAAQLVPSIIEAVTTPLREIATTGKPPARAKALDLLHTIGDDDTVAWAESAAAEDRAPGVRSLLDAWRAVAEATPTEEETPIELPPVPAIEWRAEVPRQTRAALRALLEETNRDNAARRARYAARTGAAAPPLPVDAFEAGLDALAAGRRPEPGSALDTADGWRLLHNRNLAERFAELGFPGAIGLLASVGGAVERGSILASMAGWVVDELRAAGPHPTPLELVTALDELGSDGAKAVLRAWAHPWRSDFEAIPEEEWAPLVQARLDDVLGFLEPADHAYDVGDGFVHRALATLPQLPRPAVEALFGLALGSRKRERRRSQDALAGVPGIASRVVAALTDGKSEVRAEAASWLARTRPPEALAALETAVAKERNDLAMGAMLDALQALGQPVEKYLDRDDLLAQARKLVGKGLPAALSWFPWASLPEVRWADGGEQVDVAILQWMLAQAVKAKSAEPNAVLRKYCAMFEPADRERFGQFVLDAWIAQDIGPITPDEAMQRARQEAGQIVSYIQQYPQAGALHYGQHVGATLEQVVATLLPRHLRTPVGSATAAKGALAVAAACAGALAAPVAAAYLKEWYGQRPSQGRALIAMLAWVEHPSAIQLVLSVGSRFRTKSFQEEATRQAEALAERKGWTMGELADRTIPTAGFDETGVLELPYGDRVFTARLLPDLTIELRSPDGGTIKALPQPRQTDDAEQAKTSKRLHAAAKKELKDVAANQRDRLYEALCTGRTWSAELWSTYLNGHPVARFLTQRVVWTATAPDGTVTLFRPLDDGTLTDVEDQPVQLGAEDTIGLAHDTATTEELAAAWIEHLADYEVTPLFQQFGNARYDLSDEARKQSSIDEFEGHLIEAFKLRGRANKLGYLRGPAEDGGVFFTYLKRFPTLGLTTILHFSGNTLPEENRTVALHDLRFERVRERGGGSVVRLGDVPAILLSEAYADLRSIAAAGTGFDPDWQKKVEW